jgi:hypothetical protein
MLDRLRYLFSSPLAQLERPRAFWRFFPWALAAAASISVGLAAYFYQPYLGVAVVGHWAFQLAVLAILPTTSALCFLTERSRGSLESLVLTPEDRLRLVLSRLWRLVRPWMGAMVLLLPVYWIVSTPSLRVHPFGPFEWLLLAPQPVVYSQDKIFFDSWSGIGGGAFHSIDVHVVYFFTMIHDLLMVIFVAASGLMIGVRFRGVWQGLALSYLLGPVLLATLCRADLWLFKLAPTMFQEPTSYAAWLNSLSVLEFLFLLVLPVLMIRGARRGLDREKT